MTKAFTMIAIIILGYILKRIGFLKKEHFRTLSRLSFTVTLPCVIIGKFSTFEFDRSFLIFIPIGIAMNCLTMLIGYLLDLKGNPEHKGFNMVNLSGSNVGSFALPFVQNYLGAEGVVAACVFDCGNSIMCTGGNYAAASMVTNKGERKGIGFFLKKLFTSIPVDTYIIMTTLSFLGIHLPKAILSFTDTVGAANAFLAMTVIGIGFEWRLKREQIGRAFLCVGVRLLFSLAAALLFWNLLPFSEEVRTAMVMVAFAPVSAMGPVFTQWIGQDENLASTVNSLSILCSTIIILCLMVHFG